MKETILTECSGFDWDEANWMKNFKKHKVSSSECEEVFFNTPLLMHEDTKHSLAERRLYVLGKTNEGRRLFIAFTMRNDQIRVISARDMSKQERRIYEQT